MNLVFRGPTAADRPIVLFQRVRHHLLSQRRGGFAIKCQQQAATGGTVQPMHEEDGFTELHAQAVGGKIGLTTRQSAVVDHQASGLVDHRQRGIGMEHLQRRIIAK